MWSTGQLRWKFVMLLASLVNIQSKAHVISKAISVCTRRSTEQIPFFSMLQTRLSSAPANFGSWAPSLSTTIDLTTIINGWTCTAILPSQSFLTNSVHVSAKPKGAAIFRAKSLSQGKANDDHEGWIWLSIWYLPYVQCFPVAIIFYHMHINIRYFRSPIPCRPTENTRN